MWGEQVLLVLFKKWLNSTVGSTREPEGESPESMVERIHQGDDELRNELIRRYRPYLIKTVSRFFRRSIDPIRDDAFSVALAGFDEAISRYSPEKGRSFLGFAETVVRRRLVDYVRQETKQAAAVPYSALDAGTEGSDGVVLRAEAAMAMDVYRAEREIEDRRTEIAALAEELALFGITFSELADLSPRHRDSREQLQRIGRMLASEKKWLKSLRDNRQLPLKELCEEAGASRKTIERHRKYIIAVGLIAGGQYPFLRDYIGMDQEERGESL